MHLVQHRADARLDADRGGGRRVARAAVGDADAGHPRRLERDPVHVPLGRADVLGRDVAAAQLVDGAAQARSVASLRGRAGSSITTTLPPPWSSPAAAAFRSSPRSAAGRRGGRRPPTRSASSGPRRGPARAPSSGCDDGAQPGAGIGDEDDLLVAGGGHHVEDGHLPSVVRVGRRTPGEPIPESDGTVLYVASGIRRPSELDPGRLGEIVARALRGGRSAGELYDAFLQTLRGALSRTPSWRSTPRTASSCACRRSTDTTPSCTRSTSTRTSPIRPDRSPSRSATGVR